MSTDVSKCAQVVFELMCKAAELIIQSKVQLGGRTGARVPNSKFSLHVQEIEFVRNSMKTWENNLTIPLRIDIFWEEHTGDAAPRRELLEKWEISYEAQDAIESKSAQLRHFFKRSIVFLRTLYSFVRLLPAYNVQKRIQTSDPSLIGLREDTGFCLYPGDSRGSGLDFSTFHGGEEQEHAGQSCRSASTSRYAFKPLDAPNGSVTVRLEYRRGVDSKACQYGHASTSSSSLAPNMTTSLIQDYVPQDYERTSAAARMPGMETNRDWPRPRLPSTPEDGAAAVRSRTVDSYGYHAGVQARTAPTDSDEAYVEAVTPDRDAAAAAAAAAASTAAATDIMHWPSPPELGHGYAERRVHKQLVGQGPAPFLTPGPHRGRMLSLNNIVMEPLDLGPNAGSHPRAPPLPDVGTQQESDDVFEVGDRFSLGELSVGSGRAESHGSSEAMVRTVGGGDGAGVGGRGYSRAYRRNSISESSSTPPVPREQTLMSLHGVRHGTSMESTPPFSYCESSEASPLALAQPPLVSFSPPFDAAHVGPHGQGQGHGHGHDSTFGSSPLFGMRIHHPRTSVPVLLESLPESPFSWKGAGTQPPAGSMPASFSRPLLPASMGSSTSQQPTIETSAGDDKTEGLPFSAPAENPGTEGGFDFSSPPSTLFALCAAASSSSVSVLRNNPPPGEVDGAIPDTATTSFHLPPRSLEDDLEQFRHFQQELEKR